MKDGLEPSCITCRKLPRLTFRERFERKVESRGPDECHPWTGTLDKNGYGTIGSGGKDGSTLYSHRVAWELENGPIPPGLEIRHYVCNNRWCCNVRHMLLGTKKDNSDDKARFGTNNQGERDGMAKLTEPQVLEIRTRLANGELQRVLAGEFDISQPAISAIKHRRSWTHI